MYFLKVNDRNPGVSGVFIVNFEHNLHLFLVLLLLTLNKYMLAGLEREILELLFRGSELP